LHQEGLVGDFDATFHYEDFVAGGVGAYLHADVQAPADGAGVYARAFGSLHLEDEAMEIWASVSEPDGGGKVETRMTTGDSGIIRFQRTNEVLTVTVTAGTAAVSHTKLLREDPLSIEIYLAASGQFTQSRERSSVHVTSFDLVGGGDVVKADTFDCSVL
jgi:hypothetical protein